MIPLFNTVDFMIWFLNSRTKIKNTKEFIQLHGSASWLG